MKTSIKLLFVLTSNCLLLISCCYGQAPQALPYQAVARDNTGNLISNQNISIRFSIRDGITGGPVIYQETHSVITNALGLFTINVGGGVIVSGAFSTINWGGGSKFLQVEMDSSGGSLYTDMGTQQMLSVPYALNAANGNWTKNGNDIFNSNSGKVGIGISIPNEKLEVAGNLRIGGTITCMGGTCPTNGAIRITPNLHLNSGAGYATIINWDNGTTGANQTLRIGNGAGSDVFYVYADGQAFTTNWWRSIGNTGWYSQTYGGGWHMTDATWLRSYNTKPILASGGIAGYGNGGLGTLYSGSPRMYANYDNAAGGGIAVSDDGGFFDFNDAWVQFRGSTGLQIRTNNATTALQVNMSDVNGGGTTDKQIVSSTNAWGAVGISGQAWWQMWSFAYNNASQRELKKDITPVVDGVKNLVMKDLDELTPYLYRYNIETDEFAEGKEAKYRPGLHMGLMTDDAPDYVQAQSFQGIDIYAVATLGVAASKYNREEIKEIKTALGMNETTTVAQDFGTTTIKGNETWVSFSPSFAEQLNGTTPVITVTPHQTGAQLSVTERNGTGFKVVNTSADPTSFDFIAMARIAVQKNEVAVPTDVINRMYVDKSVKEKVKNYWNTQEAVQKKTEEQAGKDALQVQKDRAVLMESTKAK